MYWLIFHWNNKCKRRKCILNFSSGTFGPYVKHMNASPNKISAPTAPEPPVSFYYYGMEKKTLDN